MESTLDRGGRRTGRSTPAGVSSAYTYDKVGQLSSVDVAGEPVEFSRDQTGRVTAVQYAHALVGQTWTPTGLLASQIVTTSSAGATTDSGAAAPSASDVSRPAAAGPAVTVPAANVSAGGVSASPFADALDGHIKARRRFTYSPAGTVTSISDLQHGRLSYTNDVMGQVTAITPTTTSSDNTGAGSWSQSYAYDASGNTTSVNGQANEYPFAGSQQGGSAAHVQEVPISEQNYQGGKLSSFYRENNISHGMPYDVEIGK